MIDILFYLLSANIYFGLVIYSKLLIENIFNIFFFLIEIFDFDRKFLYFYYNIIVNSDFIFIVISYIYMFFVLNYGIYKYFVNFLDNPNIYDKFETFNFNCEYFFFEKIIQLYNSYNFLIILPFILVIFFILLIHSLFGIYSVYIDYFQKNINFSNLIQGFIPAFLIFSLILFYFILFIISFKVTYFFIWFLLI